MTFYVCWPNLNQSNIIQSVISGICFINIPLANLFVCLSGFKQRNHCKFVNTRVNFVFTLVNFLPSSNPPFLPHFSPFLPRFYSGVFPVTGQRPFLPNMSPGQWIDLVESKRSLSLASLAKYFLVGGQFLYRKKVIIRPACLSTLIVLCLFKH